MRYAQALIAQTEQIAVCSRHHSPEQQPCRGVRRGPLYSWMSSPTYPASPNMIDTTDAQGRFQRPRPGGARPVLAASNSQQGEVSPKYDFSQYADGWPASGYKFAQRTSTKSTLRE
jgi:hypothetical protein